MNLIVLFCVRLLKDNKLQEKFGTCNISWMVITGDRKIKPWSATNERWSSIALILKFHTQDLYEENKLDSLVI